MRKLATASKNGVESALHHTPCITAITNDYVFV